MQEPRVEEGDGTKMPLLTVYGPSAVVGYGKTAYVAFEEPALAIWGTGNVGYDGGTGQAGIWGTGNVGYDGGQAIWGTGNVGFGSPSAGGGFTLLP